MKLLHSLLCFVQQATPEPVWALRPGFQQELQLLYRPKSDDERSMLQEALSRAALSRQFENDLRSNLEDIGLLYSSTAEWALTSFEHVRDGLLLTFAGEQLRSHFDLDAIQDLFKHIQNN